VPACSSDWSVSRCWSVLDIKFDDLIAVGQIIMVVIG
jgi:hypothetical protein